MLIDRQTHSLRCESLCMMDCSEMGASGKVVEDAAIEHARIEVDATVPGEEAVVPLLVDHGLVGVVVVLDNLLIVILRHEILRSARHVLKVLVRLVAHDHRPAVVRLSVAHVLVATGDILVVVVVKSTDELVIEAWVLHRA